MPQTDDAPICGKGKEQTDANANRIWKEDEEVVEAEAKDADENHACIAIFPTQMQFN